MSSAWQRLRVARERRDPQVVLTRAEVGELLERAPRPLTIDPDYADRAGVRRRLPDRPRPAPGARPLIADDVAIPIDADGDPVLRYHHFSIVLSASRRLARWTAANLDGRRRYVIDRSG